MGLPFTFASVTGNQPGSNLDSNFNYLLGLLGPLGGISLPASETLAPGALVNIWESGSVFEVRNANGAGASGFAAQGFVIAPFTATQTAVVFPSGVIAGLSGLVGGPVFLGATAGAITQTPPANGSGNYSQLVGFAISANSIVFQPGLMNGPF